MKIRLRPFRTHTRSRTIDAPTNDATVIRAIARQLLEDFELDAPVRLLGVGVAGLVRTSEPAADSAEPEPADRPLTLDV
jgi:DNA polymerase-4